MPQNTPMKRQFITIDGRTVMSNLPQHWGGNDWTITGVDNPLPVGNYVQTEAGVWIPQKGSDDGAADVRLTGSNVVLASGIGVSVPANSTFEPSPVLKCIGSRLGIIGRWSQSIESTTVISRRNASGTYVGGQESIDNGNQAHFENKYELSSGYVRVGFRNNSSVDATLIYEITDFL